jgi:AraC family transcriptional regulator of adaptative response / DNA-3-methyladenine glycosylase II
VLHAPFRRRRPARARHLDGYELAVRAVLGQQITVAAARTLAQRLVDRFGEPIETPFAQFTRLFPAPACWRRPKAMRWVNWASSSSARPPSWALRARWPSGRVALHGGADVQATVIALKALPGIGDWTAQYIAMRALRWPDAFPAGDVALQSALGVRSTSNNPRAPPKPHRKPGSPGAAMPCSAPGPEERRHDGVDCY